MVTRLPARPKSQESLWISYMHADEFDRLSLHETATISSDHDEYEWERVEKDGRQLMISDAGPTAGRKIYLTQKGTHVEIDSDLDRDRLIDLALSLRPAVDG